MSGRHTKLWKLISDELAAGRPAVLMVVPESIGSSPGRRGFRMALALDGRSEGTIGGGVMEHRLSRTSRDEASRGELTIRLLRQVHSKSAPEDRSGMICAGEQRVIVCGLGPESGVHAARALELLGAGRIGILSLSPNGLEVRDAPERVETVFEEQPGGAWRYEECFGTPSQIFIVGGGHVGFALSNVMSTLDFRIVVVDHRPDLDLFTRNPHADELALMRYESLRERVPEGDDIYVAIVSTNFKTDEAALRAVIGKRLRYLGVMGSTAKIDHLFGALRSEGVPEGVLAAIDAPIGVPIASRTAEEIAVSIAARIIGVKNGAWKT